MPKRDPNTGHFLPKSKRSAAMRTAASSIGRIFRGNPTGTVWFKVYLGGRLIDEVPYSASAKMTAADVKRSLVEHDGYNPSIRVVRARKSPGASARRNPSRRPAKVTKRKTTRRPAKSAKRKTTRAPKRRTAKRRTRR